MTMYSIDGRGDHGWMIMHRLYSSCIMTEKKFRVAVAGASGYAGGEMLRLLLATQRSRSAR